jgi:thioredoxin-related protein
MRTTLTILLAMTMSALLLGCQSGESKTVATELSWKSFDEGANLAKTEHKKLLVDVYTDWCTWCKKMDRETYTDEKVVKVLSTRYIVVKLNAESSKQLTYNGHSFTETQLARAMGVSGYPTTVFLDPDTKPITKVAGYIPGKDFINIVRFIGEDYYKTTTYQDFLSKQGTSKVE